MHTLDENKVGYYALALVDPEDVLEDVDVDLMACENVEITSCLIC